MKTIILSSFIAIILFSAEYSYAQDPPAPPEVEICCQYEVLGTITCSSGVMSECGTAPGFTLLGTFRGQRCNGSTGLCGPIPRNVPTISEWGLIAIADILGIIGFMVIRRRATA